jgi:hypothetical protein
MRNYTNKTRKVYRGKTYHYGGMTLSKVQAEAFKAYDKKAGYSAFYETIKDEDGVYFLLWTTSKEKFEPYPFRSK